VRTVSKLEEAGTHKSVKTHASTVVLSRVTLTFDLKMNRFPRLMVEHFHVKFGDPSCSGF